MNNLFFHIDTSPQIVVAHLTPNYDALILYDIISYLPKKAKQTQLILLLSCVLENDYQSYFQPICNRKKATCLSKNASIAGIDESEDMLRHDLV